MKNKKYIEELLNEQDINFKEILNSKRKNPFRHWLKFNMLVLKDKIEDIGYQLVGNIRYFLK
jgi:hypothetical protein